ncbi:MAG: ankyrin repeat domain-containing protein [Verrucomicrobia bacterium]|nr:ankyrin repeat domain-containing protein [Verrucomicrobiota bacterium]
MFIESIKHTEKFEKPSSFLQHIAPTAEESPKTTSYRAQTRLLKGLTAAPFQFDSNNLIEECQNNPRKWPPICWAVLKLNRPDIALEILKKDPEQAHAKTPSRWETHSVWADFGHGIGYGEALTKVTYKTAETSILSLAILAGSAELVDALLKLGANPNTFQKFNQYTGPYDKWDGPRFKGLAEFTVTPLSQAIGSKNHEIVQLLLDAGASIEKTYLTFNRPWHPQETREYGAVQYAVQTGQDDKMLEILLKKGRPLVELANADYELIRKYSQTTKPPIYAACAEGDFRAAQRLLDLGFNPFETNLFDLLNTPKLADEAVDFLLRNNLHRDLLLQESVKRNQMDLFSRTLAFQPPTGEALRIAIEKGYDHFIHSLIDQTPATPPILLQAIRSKRFDLVEKLTPLADPVELQKSFDKNESGIWVDLVNQPDTLRFFIGQKFTFQAQSLLPLCVKKGKLAALKALEETYGISQEMKKQLIRIAVQEKKEDFFDYLLQR